MNRIKVFWTSAAAMMSVISASAVHAQGGPGGGGPGGPGGGGGRGFGAKMMANATPEQKKKFEAWQAFNDKHKNFRELSTTTRAVGELDKDAATKLTKDQAKKIFALVKPWTGKPVMKDAEALTLSQKIKAALSKSQLAKLDAMAAQAASRRGGFGGPGGPGGPGGMTGRLQVAAGAPLTAGGGPRKGAVPAGVPGGPGGPGMGGAGGPGMGGPGGRMGGGKMGGKMGGMRMDPSQWGDPKEYNPLNVATFPKHPMLERGKQRVTDFLTLVKTRSM